MYEPVSTSILRNILKENSKISLTLWRQKGSLMITLDI